LSDLSPGQVLTSRLASGGKKLLQNPILPLEQE
jgi:hypothetical protein